MHRNLIWSLLIFTVLFASSEFQPAMAQAAPKPPNIIFIMFDDLGYGGIEVFRNLDLPSSDPVITTPNLDLLAAEGLMFTQFYANAPVCSPTRSSVLSGRYPADFGIRTIVTQTSPRKGVPGDIQALPQLLQSHGYYTAHVGKWHLGGEPYGEFEPTTKGYDRTAIKQGGGYLSAKLKVDGTSQQTNGQHLTRRLIDQAKSAVDLAIAANKKLFLNLWLLTPHAPYCEIPDSASGHILPPTPLPTSVVSEFDHHARLVNNADFQIGLLVDYLKTKGILANTLILVTSDNGGYPLFRSELGFCQPACASCPNAPCPAMCKGGREFLTNGPYNKGKASTFEGGTRVPMIVSWPDVIQQPEQVGSPIITFDLFPTLAEVAGISMLPPGLPGTSFAGILLDPATAGSDDRTFVWENKSRLRAEDLTWAVRASYESTSYKLISESFMTAPAAKLHLYDIVADPFETMDLLPAPPAVPTQQALDIRDALTAIYRQWRVDTGLIDIAGFDIEGDATTAYDEQGRLEAKLNRSPGSANDGRLLLKADPRVDVNMDDFTFRAWIRPDSSIVDNAAAETIAHKEGSWTLRLTAADRLALTITPLACTGDVTTSIPGCGESPRTLEVEQDLSASSWYHVAFTTFHDFSKGLSADPAEIELYLWEFTDSPAGPTVHMAPKQAGDRAPPASTMTRLSFGAIDPTTEVFRGKIVDPSPYHARLDLEQLEDLAGQPQILVSCPVNQNHSQWAGSAEVPPGSLGGILFGSIWETRVYQGPAPACCNPSLACNLGNECLPKDAVESVLGELVCARTPGNSAPALYSCTPLREGAAIQNAAGTDQFCCEGGVFVPLVGSSCQ